MWAGLSSLMFTMSTELIMLGVSHPEHYVSHLPPYSKLYSHLPIQILVMCQFAFFKSTELQQPVKNKKS